MQRREFLKTSILASGSAVIAAGCAATRAGRSGSDTSRRTAVKQEYYELRAYRLTPGSTADVLHAYLETAAIPAWNRLGSNPVGVFTESSPGNPASVFVLIPYPPMEEFGRSAGKLAADNAYRRAAEPYLNAPKDRPAYDRIDSWVMLAFAGMPRIDLPVYCRQRKPRLFEMRTYESHNDVKAAKKVAMFNDGEIDLMREVGLAPIFFGQALWGPSLPHLTYMTSAENDEAHKAHWAAFQKHPKWDQMKNDPQYADTVSRITKWFLVPTAYSQI